MTRPTSDTAHEGTIGADDPLPAALILEGHLGPEELGGKGRSLDRLIDWGLPVPPTGAVTASAYRRFVSQGAVAAMITSLRDGADLSADEIDDRFEVATFTPGDADSIIAVGRAVGRGSPLAVRSSATVEDLERSSFAGQYRSVLGVDAQDANALLVAVKTVFASLWHPAPCAYRRGFGIGDEDAAMAVVLMQMVPAQRAGVVFTVDPGGDAARARIEVVEGLGESLVSGSQTPDAVVLPSGGCSWRRRAGAVDRPGPRIARRGAGRRPTGCRVGVGRRPRSGWSRPARSPHWIRRGDGFDDPADELDVMDLTTAGIGEMLPGCSHLWCGASPATWSRRRSADCSTISASCPPTSPGRRAIVRVRGRAAMDFARLRGMAGALPGAAADRARGGVLRVPSPGPDAAAPEAQPFARSAPVRPPTTCGCSACGTAPPLDAAITAVATTGILADAARTSRPRRSPVCWPITSDCSTSAGRAMAAEVGVAADADGHVSADSSSCSAATFGGRRGRS